MSMLCRSSHLYTLKQYKYIYNIHLQTHVYFDIYRQIEAEQKIFLNNLMGILLYPLCLHIDNTYISIYLFFAFIRSLTYNCIQCLKASVINTSGSWPMASSFLFHIKLTLDISNIFLSTNFFFYIYRFRFAVYRLSLSL